MVQGKPAILTQRLDRGHFWKALPASQGQKRTGTISVSNSPCKKNSAYIFPRPNHAHIKTPSFVVWVAGLRLDEYFYVTESNGRGSSNFFSSRAFSSNPHYRYITKESQGVYLWNLKSWLNVSLDWNTSIWHLSKHPSICKMDFPGL